MMYVIVQVMMAVMFFVTGYMVSKIRYGEMIKDANNLFRYINKIKSSEYKRGYESGMTARYEMDEV